MRNVMTRLIVARYRWLPALVLAAGLVAIFGSGGHVVAQEGGALAVDCEGNSLEIDTDCDFGEGQEFTITLQVDSAPPGGFSSIQAWLSWDDSALEYRGKPNPNQEAVWPDCVIPARAPEPPTGESPQLLSCTPLPFPITADELFEYEGPFLLLTFACAGEGTSTLTLLPRDEDQFGSYFIEESLNPIDPALEEASVTCGGPPQARPPVEVETRPPGTEVPVPGVPTLPPGEDGDTTPDPGATPVPTQTPGGPTATPETTPTRVASDDDDDDDDGGFPVWGWILIGLGAVAGVGGVGFLLWRRMNEGGTAASGAGEGDTGGPQGDDDA